ncbi:MAG: hypothetical protein L6R39_001752 [Caloplaca ligustica]|nr:MAG: hypothetical protein L6R39_001752 [Caloplaca ligustica]
MSTDYTYDEQGQFFPYFILTISALVTVPLTYSLLKPTKELENTAPRIKSDFKPPDDNLIQGQKRKQWRRERRLKRIITVVAGYATMALMLYLIAVTKTTLPKIWDPYDILDVSRSAGEKDITQKYRKLSRQHHPDKAQHDPSNNQTLEEINEYWVELSKAYKALTDEEVRNNYIQFGHPDGKQSFSIGIALPKFIVTEGNGKYVLLVYGLLLGVLLPYVVGKWWYGTQKLTKDKVLLASAGNLFREYSEDLTDGGVINALTSGEEYKDVLTGHKADTGLAKIEKLIGESDSFGRGTTGLLPSDRQMLENSDGVRRKTLALLWAYLGRVKLDGAALDDGECVPTVASVLYLTLKPEKYEIAPLALALNEAFTSICLAYGNVPQILAAYHASQNLIQAVPPNASPLLQLPYITPSIARLIEGSSARDRLTIQAFMSLPEYKRRKLATDQPNTLTPSQYNTAVAVARQLPFLHLEKVFFKVTGEKFVTTGSLVQMVVKARVIPPGSTHVPPVNPSDLEDIDPDEGDLDALLGRKPNQSKKAKVLDDDTKPSSAEEVQQPLQPPLAYAPYFPRDHSPRWHVFLSEPRLHKMTVPPFTFTTFNKPLFHPAKPPRSGLSSRRGSLTGGGASSSSSTNTVGEPTYNMQTFKCQFQAPLQVGKYPFVMHLVCDSYVGMDAKAEVVLEVEDQAKAAEMDGGGGDESDEISEPDEDSIAAHMASLKTGGAAAAAAQPKRKKKVQAAESSDDESDTEGDAGSDTSDTNTDTDSDGE